MKILIVGNGGREHALAWKLSQSPRADRIFVAPGNAGTAVDVENVAIPVTDTAGLVKFAKSNEVQLTVVGPEAPLAAGLVDAMTSEGLRVFGPNQAAAELEASKVFCKNLLRQADVPTADYQVFRNAETARRYLNDRHPDAERLSVVIKADGLAAGKGVIVCSTRTEALEAIDRIAEQKGVRSGRKPAGDRGTIDGRRGERDRDHGRTDDCATLPGTGPQGRL